MNDRCSKATVRLTGSVVVGGARSGDGGGEASAFEIVRSMGARAHKLRFTIGDEVHDGTLAQVQEQVEALLCVSALPAIAFFGQVCSHGPILVMALPAIAFFGQVHSYGPM